MFFEGDRAGPPSVSLDEVLSEHHVADCIRANRHVMLGEPVFPDDVVGGCKDVRDALSVDVWVSHDSTILELSFPPMSVLSIQALPYFDLGGENRLK